MEDIFYTGTVKNAPNGFGFIDLKTVQREDDTSHGLETTADIFVPQTECAVPLREGLILRFKVKPNEQKGVRERSRHDGLSCWAGPGRDRAEGRRGATPFNPECESHCRRAMMRSGASIPLAYRLNVS